MRLGAEIRFQFDEMTLNSHLATPIVRRVGFQILHYCTVHTGRFQEASADIMTLSNIQRKKDRGWIDKSEQEDWFWLVICWTCEQKPELLHCIIPVLGNYFLDYFEQGSWVAAVRKLRVVKVCNPFSTRCNLSTGHWLYQTQRIFKEEDQWEDRMTMTWRI